MTKKTNNKIEVIEALIVLTIFIIGMFMKNTTVILFAFGIMLLIIIFNKDVKKN